MQGDDDMALPSFRSTVLAPVVMGIGFEHETLRPRP
jgi:hypothetical protein